MSEERSIDDEAFLSRWSRRKKEARESPPDPAEKVPVEAQADTAAPDLPALDELTMDSDFRGFFHPKVDEGVRRAALRKLFSDPHFNVMDGLDVYIDDYSKSDPIPPEMLAGLKQAQRILRWAEGKDDEPADADAVTGDRPPDGTTAPAPVALEAAAAEPLSQSVQQRDPVVRPAE